MKNEIWKPVLGYEGKYEVSDLGNIRSIYREQTFDGRWGPTMMRFPAKIMRQYRSTTGYRYLGLSKEAQQVKLLVHRIVMAAFIGPSELQVNHKDGDKSNNSLENLEYCTPHENCMHSTRILKNNSGERNGNAKLKSFDIAKIRADTRILREIAEEYGVTLQAIHYVKKGKNWEFHD